MTAITQDWQARLVERDLLIGRGTNYPGLGGMTGLGILAPRASGQQRGLADGDSFGTHRYPARTLALPVQVLGDTDADRWQNWRALASAWRRSDTDLALDVRIPGMAETTMRYYGRPFGLIGDPHGLKSPVSGTAEFRCDPFAYGAAVDSAVDSSSPLVVTNAGDAATDRATLTVDGNGGTPTITNTTTGGVIAFRDALAGGQSYVIDLREQVVTRSGVNHDGDVTSSSTWFALDPGANTLTFTGCASLQVTHRPAYEVP